MQNVHEYVRQQKLPEDTATHDVYTAAAKFVLGPRRAPSSTLDPDFYQNPNIWRPFADGFCGDRQVDEEHASYAVLCSAGW